MTKINPFTKSIDGKEVRFANAQADINKGGKSK